MAERPARRPGEHVRPPAPASGVASGLATGLARGEADDLQKHRRVHREAPRAARLAAEVDRREAELDAMRRRLAEVEAIAERDPLTGVLNRRGFERELARAAAYLGRYPANAKLVYVDLDRFKPINDVHGHAGGDALLAAVAATLTRHVRASDSVARLGGDEFAVLLWNLADADALAKARLLEAAITALVVPWQDERLSVGASAGVASLEIGDRPADVLGRADAAMYARKRSR